MKHSWLVMEMNNSFLDDYDQMEEDYILIKEQKRKKKKRFRIRLVCVKYRICYNFNNNKREKQCN